MQYEKIITHNDFDGIVSAAFCSYVFKIEDIIFAGPNNIARADIIITEKDIVCDLPYPLVCGLWFDHHEGNLQELAYRKIDPNSIPGKLALQPSCARVVFDYFSPDYPLPPYFLQLVSETDNIDAFNYQSIDEWRQVTPAHIIDSAIKSRWESFNDKFIYLKKLTFWLRDYPLEKVAAYPEIIQRYDMYRADEKEILSIIKQNCFFLPEDKKNEMIILDFSNFTRSPKMDKNLAYLLFPNALSVLEIKPIFKNRIKTNDLSLSLSLSINLNNQSHAKNVGEIMRDLNLGDGHSGAAGGTLRCQSKIEMLKQKQLTLMKIINLWLKQ